MGKGKVKERLKEYKARVKWIQRYSWRMYNAGVFRTRHEAFVKCMLRYWSWI